MKVLILEEDHAGQYTTSTFAGWYSNPTVEQLVSEGFTEEEANLLLQGENVEIDGIYGEFRLEQFEEGYKYISISANRETYDNI